jgi:hypothetical protein
MKVTKGRAFVYSLISIMGVYIISAVFFKAGSEGPAFTAIVALASMYILGNVADNGVKGKFFNEGLK